MIVFLVFFFLVGSPIIDAAGTAYTAKEHILLTCGSRIPKLASTKDGQIWTGDQSSNYSPDINAKALSTPATASDVTSRTAPYLSARIIHSKFSYVFPLSAGKKILRLYFNPGAKYDSFDAANSFFDVMANERYTLLKNFSAFAFVGAKSDLVKEFIINVNEPSLKVTFVPSPGSFAFINGIEVVSLPENLYMGKHGSTSQRDKLIFVNNPNTQFDIDETSTAFETMSRWTVAAKKDISRVEDTGMFREWWKDDSSDTATGKPINSDAALTLTYTPETPAYSAPASLYKTARMIVSQNPPANLTWNFEVDSGFVYLLRLHFCAFPPASYFNGGGQTVVINGMEAETIDIKSFVGGAGIPVFRDYVALVGNPTGDGKRSRTDLYLTLDPKFNAAAPYNGAFVNGVEVFKLSSDDGYLAGVNPVFKP